MKFIFFIIVAINLLLANDTVTDKQTELVWQDNFAAKNIKRGWFGAQSYCRTLVLDEAKDWRLPSIKELQSIIDINRENPAIKKIFKNVADGDYWSSSKDASNYDYAWSVFFSYGTTLNQSKLYENYVRCVRDK